MKRISTHMFVWTFAFFIMSAASFAMDHEKMMSSMGNIAHEEVVDGVKATFKFISMKDRMKEMSMEMPKGLKETHHIMVEFKDVKTGKVLTVGEVKIKIQGPDKAEQLKDLMAMAGIAGMGAGFGADFDLSKKGKYGIMAKFRLNDDKVRNAKFWYEVK